MNTTDLIEKVAERTGLPRASVHKVLHASFDIIVETVKEGKPVRLYGLGSFSRGWRKRSSVRSLTTRRKVMIGGRHTVRFKAAKRFKDALLSLTDQSWREEAHQAAWRQAEVLIGDIDLYATEKPSLSSDTPLAEVERSCDDFFSDSWSQALSTYRNKVSTDVDPDASYFYEAARRMWSGGR